MIPDRADEMGATSCAADIDALRDMAREFTEGFNSGDVDRLMRFCGSTYVDVNLRDPVQSHEQRRAYYQQVIGRGLRIHAHPEEIVLHGRVAFVRGYLHVIRTGDNGSTTTTELRYLEIVRKDSTGWKVVWSMDGPVQEYEPESTRR